MRPKLNSIPVFGPDRIPNELPIEYIAPDEADLRVFAGLALSLRGKAIRMLRQPRLWKPRDLSAKPDHRLTMRYAEALRSGLDQRAVAAVEAWAPAGGAR